MKIKFAHIFFYISNNNDKKLQSLHFGQTRLTLRVNILVSIVK